MSDKEALHQFNKKPVNSEMVQYLVDTTYSVIKIKKIAASSYPSPPNSPDGQNQPVTLYEFIRCLIKHSNVQTPTLMSTLVYLARLRAILPSNVYGIETTRHRIFLGCLILAAKSLNDSSPINKHWAAYTDGLLTIPEVNTIERELLDYLNWDLTITQQDLYDSLSFFLIPIKAKLKKIAENDLVSRQKHFISSTPSSTRLAAMVAPRVVKNVSASSSASSVPSLLSNSSSRSTLSSINTQSSHSINNMLNQSQNYQVIMENQPKESTSNNIKHSAPMMGKGYRPLRLRSSNDNNQQLYHSASHIPNTQQLPNNNYPKSGSMMLANAGRVTASAF